MKRYSYIKVSMFKFYGYFPLKIITAAAAADWWLLFFPIPLLESFDFNNDDVDLIFCWFNIVNPEYVINCHYISPLLNRARVMYSEWKIQWVIEKKKTIFAKKLLKLCFFCSFQALVQLHTSENRHMSHDTLNWYSNECTSIRVSILAFIW